MGRVSATAVNPMTAAGDTIIGGGGTPTSYGADAAFGKAVTADSTFGGFNASGITDGDAGSAWAPTHGAPGAWFYIDLTAPQKIGKWRLLQSGGVASEYLVQASPDAVTWTTIVDYFVTANDETVVIASPATARYWRFYEQAGSGQWTVLACNLFPVVTVGAGNQARLPGPPERRVLSYNPLANTPEWQAKEAAIAKLADAFGVAGAIVDAGAAYSQANVNNNFRSVSDKLDALITALQNHGILT